MKKYIIIAMAAILMAACTYKSDIVSQKTPANLASLNVELINNTVGAAVLTLMDADLEKKDTILTATYDTLLTSEAYYNRFGSYACEMQIQHIADSTWSFSSTGTGSVTFLGTIFMSGRNKEGYPILGADYDGFYDEGDGYSADFSSAKLEYTLETTPVFVQGYGYVYQLTILCYGTAALKTYLNNAPLDSITTTFDGQDIKY